MPSSASKANATPDGTQGIAAEANADGDSGFQSCHFSTMTVAEAQARLAELCEQVCNHNGRVTLAGQTAADHVVLISCEELDAIEEALCHFGDSDHGKKIGQELSGLIGKMREESITPRELIAKARKLASY